MQTFQDANTGKVWQFNPDVLATETAGVYSFIAANGTPLNVPTTLQPYTLPPAPDPTPAQQAIAALGAGVAIASTGTPALNATYPTSGSVWNDMKDEAIFVATFGEFSSGTSSIAFTLAPGVTVTFTATAQLQAVVKAIGVYITALKTIAATNAGTLPASTVAIA